MRRYLLSVAALIAALTLAACGGDDDGVGGGADQDVPTAEAGPVEGEITISNWPGYIDKGEGNTIDEFEAETGVTVKYAEDINDNVQFFNQIKPQLDQGSSGGRSLLVVTDWMARRMHDLGYVQNINQDDIATVTENLAPQFETAGADREFAVPWQGGMTGIWVNTSEAPDVTSINDLFDPQYQGRVTMLSELRDTVPLVLKGEGIEVEDATKEDWLEAIEKIDQAIDSGQIRRITGNEYTEDLTSGNVVAAIGWSGDESLIGRDDAEWRMPEEGCMVWFDNMVIPVGAPNTAAALEFMNFVYRPEVQADIAEFVNYVTPVDGVQEILTQRDEELGTNELIFPTEEFVEPCDAQPDPPGDAEDVAEVEAAFQEVIAG